MKILIATTSGDSAGLIKGQGQYLKGIGYEVIYSASSTKKAHELVKNESLIFEAIPFDRDINIINDIRCLIKAIKILRKQRPDIVNAGTPKAGLIYMIAAKFVGIKGRVFTLRGIRSDTLTGIKKQVVRLAEKTSCLMADKVVAIAPSQRDKAIELKLTRSDKLVVFGNGSSNGIDLERFAINDAIISKEKSKREELGLISDDTIIFGFVGRIVKDKGVEELIDAFEKLSEKQNVKLIIVGTFEADNAIGCKYKTCIKNNKNIIYVGYSSEIPLYTYIFDALVMPSYREGFGNSIIEAAAMGTPAIGTNIVGISDAIEENKTGLLVQARDPESLYKAMNLYATNPTLREEHGENAAKRAHAHFGNHIIWEGQRKLYAEITTSKHSS